MSDCPYHITIERTVSAHDVELDAHKEQISALFAYKEQLQKTHEMILVSLEGLKNSQHDLAGTLYLKLNRIDMQLTETRKDFEAASGKLMALEDEKEKFDWFTGPMNKLQGKLPWFVLGIILLMGASLVMSLEGLNKIVGAFKAVINIFK